MINSVLVYDETGFSVDLARVLSKVVPETYYFREWVQGGFPDTAAHVVGTGIPGITRVEDFEKLKKEKKIDLVIFTDIYRGSKQIELQDQGYKVIGSRAAEWFEIYKDDAKDMLKKLGLPSYPDERMQGMTALRKFLKEHKDQYVKVNKHRGFSETFHSIDYDLIEYYLDELEHRLGSLKEEKKFMVEPKFPPHMVEIGLDPYISDGKVADIVMGGIEDKDNGYFACVQPFVDYPECMRVVIEKMLPLFGELGYRGPFSYEAKVGKELIPNVLDSTMRFGNPPGSLQWYMYRKNLIDILEGVASGTAVSPEGYKRFGLELTLKSPQAEDLTLPIRVPKEIRDNVFLANYRQIEGKDDLYYIIPQPEKMEEFGSVVTEGDSFEECKAKMYEVCDKIQGFQVEITLSAIANLEKEITKLDEFGINFYKSEKPKEEVKIEPPKPEPPQVQPTNPINPKVKKFLEKIQA